MGLAPKEQAGHIKLTGSPFRETAQPAELTGPDEVGFSRKGSGTASEGATVLSRRWPELSRLLGHRRFRLAPPTCVAMGGARRMVDGLDGDKRAGEQAILCRQFRLCFRSKRLIIIMQQLR